MPATDSDVQQALGAVAQRIEVARAAGVEGPFARIIERLEELKNQPATVESGEEMLRLADELNQHIEESSKITASAETVGGRSELTYDQQQALQEGIRSQLSTLATDVRQSSAQKGVGMRARRGRRVMI